MPSGTQRARRVVVVGAGTVGAATVPRLVASGVEVAGVLVRDATRPRGFAGWRELVTDDPAVVDDADVLVEVAGGTGAVADLALGCLARGALLVSANKAALAERWDDFAPYLRDGRVWCEAAVMAGTPVVGALTGALRGCSPLSAHAVLNGTCNVLLSGMEEGRAYQEVLAEAQRDGLAEADPTLDVTGVDAAHKLSLVARLAFDPELAWQAVAAATRGVVGIGADAVAAAASAGEAVRLVASLTPSPTGWQPAVRPLALPRSHPLVASGATNALLFTGVELGTVLMRGPGAGAGSTATAVVSDVLSALAGARGHTPREAADVPDVAGPVLPEGAREL